MLTGRGGDPTGEDPVLDIVCVDEAPEKVVPYLALAAGEYDVEEEFTVGLAPVGDVNKWTLNDVIFFNRWDYPSKCRPPLPRQGF